VALAAWRKAPRVIVAGGLVALALLMLWGAYLGAFTPASNGSLGGPAGMLGRATLGPRRT
jgi:hypothetical protein